MPEMRRLKTLIKNLDYSTVIFLPSFDNFSVLAYESKKYLLEIKESLLIMRDKPSLNRNINSAPLYLVDKVS